MGSRRSGVLVDGARGLSAALLACALTVVTVGAVVPNEADAIPYFARRYDVGCSTCHSVVPKLNRTGMNFRARGYVLPERDPQSTIPVAAWLSGRLEDRPDADAPTKVFPDKVELISGGRISPRISYFVEWRALSLDLRDSGELRDRSGRFEDLFVNVDLADGLAATLGQFRLFQQFDNSLRLSASTPLALNAGVAGTPEPGDSARQAGLRSFSPAGRSPSVMLSYRAPVGSGTNRPADGLWLHGALAFPGELSAPLTSEARDNASFEFDSKPKGVYLQSYYRHGLSSVGGAAFLGRDRQLYTGLVSYDPGSWNSTLALSAGVIDGDSDRRLSWWNEWQPARGANLGFRLDDSSEGPAAYHLYGDLQWASRRGVLWLLLEQRFQSGADRTVLQLNAVF